MIQRHLDKNNLHHAYLVEGINEEVLPEVFSFCESLNVKTSGNPDFVHIKIDNFKIDEAFTLRAMSAERGFSKTKKIFIISTNTLSLDAQNVLLKMFEEPREDTHFFLIVPDANALLKTLVSRFYFISARSCGAEDKDSAEKFLKMPLKGRLDFIKDFLVSVESDEVENLALDSTRAKALRFLNTLELVLHNKADKRFYDFCFPQFFKVRKFLRMPGSSTKTLLESIALVIPDFKN